MKVEEMYQKIGKILTDSGPVNAKKIIVKAELFSENDGGTYEFDYIDNKNEINWYDLDAKAIADLTEYLVLLKRKMLEDNMTNGFKIWEKCLISLDVEKNEINFKLNYND